jgi:YHS domain-containing protein
MKKFAVLVLFVVLALAFATVGLAEEGHDHSKHKHENAVAPKVFDSPQKIGTKATCPVLGNEFVIHQDTLHSEYQGKHVYFCCAMCKPQFDKEPEKYLKKK